MRARGRPHKEPQPHLKQTRQWMEPKKNKLCWQKKSNAARWRYEKLTSEDTENYCKSENATMKERIGTQHQHIIDAASGSSEVYKHIPDTPKSIAHEKSLVITVHKIYTLLN